MKAIRLHSLHENTHTISFQIWHCNIELMSDSLHCDGMPHEVTPVCQELGNDGVELRAIYQHCGF